MKAICGWMGDLADEQRSHELLGSMLSACGAATDADCLTGSNGRGRVGVPRGDGMLIYSDDTLVIVLSEPLREIESGQTLTAADLAALYRQQRQAVLERMDGTFAIAIIDNEQKRLILAVDRAGIRPLYVARIGDAIAFSSRLASLKTLPGFRSSIDNQAIFDYLYFHAVPSPGTIYRDCTKLLPAQTITFDGGSRQDRFYWQMPYQDDNPATVDELTREFRRLLPRIVDKDAGDRADVGTFLSGGTDSSTLAGTLTQVRDNPARTYAMGFEAAGFDEMEYARIAARHFGTDAREYYVTPQDVVDAIPLVASYCDEPFGNSSVVPAYCCARFAAGEGTRLLLAGDGGDEIFAGNARYLSQDLFELYGKIPEAMRKVLLDPLTRIPGAARIPLLKKVRSFLVQARQPLPDRLESYNFLHRTSLDEIFAKPFLSTVDPNNPLVLLGEAYGRSRSPSFLNRVMHMELKQILADNDLRKVEQACNLAGVEVAYPFLDREMMEFAARVPPRYQLKNKRLRWFFKHALEDFLPKEILVKKKHGFGLPVGIWMTEYPPLRSLVDESIEALQQRNIIRADYVEWLQEQHRSQHATYYGTMLWVMMMLEQWLQNHGH